MTGKNKCKILKEIRNKIAQENDIPFITKECTFQGNCNGTCPKCEQELAYLEQQLARRQRLGKLVTVSALALGVTLGSVGCQPEVEVLEGDVPYYAETVPSEADDSFVTEGEPTEEYESNTEEVVMGIMPVPTEEEILWGDFEYDKLPDNE